jgi:membrane peptidoglycan carboxypeptidase
MIQPGTGLVKAMSLSRPYGVDKKKNQFAVNLAVDARYAGTEGAQPGSTMKPFLNAIALADGYGMNYRIMSPYEVTRDVTIPTCTSPIKYEAEGEAPGGPTTRTPRRTASTT